MGWFNKDEEGMTHLEEFVSKLGPEIAKAKSYDDILMVLSERKLDNEVQVRNLEADTSAKEELESFEIGQYKDGDLTDREKHRSLVRIKQYRDEIKSLEERIEVYSKNVRLTIAMIQKIELVKAIESRPLDPQHIDAIMVEFQGHVEAYNEVLEAGLTGESLQVGDVVTHEEKTELVLLQGEIEKGTLNADERHALRKMEKEILGGSKKKAAKQKQRQTETEHEA